MFLENVFVIMQVIDILALIFEGNLVYESGKDILLCRLLAVPFKIVARACEPRVHSVSRLEQGEKQEKRAGRGLPLCPLHSFALVFHFCLVISCAFATVKKGTASSLYFVLTYPP